VAQVRMANCRFALGDAQLSLLRSWKQYMQTRCLLLWEEEEEEEATEAARGAIPAGGHGGAPNGEKRMRRARLMSSAASKHWGDVTSYTLVAELAAHLGRADLDCLAQEPHLQRYLIELSEMFTSMLHFKVFVRASPIARDGAGFALGGGAGGSGGGVAAALALGGGGGLGGPRGVPENRAFRKRPRSGRSGRLVLNNPGDPRQPGVVQLIGWVSGCLEELLHVAAPAPDDVASSAMASLLTGLLVLYDLVAEECGAAAESDTDSMDGAQGFDGEPVLGEPRKALQRSESGTASAVSATPASQRGRTASLQRALGDLHARTLRLLADVVNHVGRVEAIYDLCVPLLHLVLAQVASADAAARRRRRGPALAQLQPGANAGLEHAAVSSLATAGTLERLLHRYQQLADHLAVPFLEQQELRVWLERNGLGEMRVKVLSGGELAHPPMFVGSAALTMPAPIMPASLATPQSGSSPAVPRAASWGAAASFGGGAHALQSSTSQSQAAATAAANKENLAAEAADRLREIGRVLGYKSVELAGGKGGRVASRVAHQHHLGRPSGEEGLIEVSVIHLLVDSGVASVAALCSLDDDALQNMGIYKQSDRRRLLGVIKQQQQEQHQTSFSPLQHQPLLDQQSRPHSRGEQAQQAQQAQKRKQEQLAQPQPPPAIDAASAPASQPAKRVRRSAQQRFSRAASLREQREQARGLLRMEVTLRTLSAAIAAEPALGGALVRLGVVDVLSKCPLLRAVAGDKAPAAGVDNRDNAGTLALRGYTLHGQRCAAHLVWCQALRLAADVLAAERRGAGSGATATGSSKSSPPQQRSAKAPSESAATQSHGRAVEHALSLLACHRGSVLAALAAFGFQDSVLTLGGLEETEACAALLRELAHHSQRWRLRGELFGPLLQAAWATVQDLVVGTDPSRRAGLLEEFARGFFGTSRLVPRLCSMTRCVTAAEVQLQRVPASEALAAAQGVNPGPLVTGRASAGGGGGGGGGGAGLGFSPFTPRVSSSSPQSTTAQSVFSFSRSSSTLAHEPAGGEGGAAEPAVAGLKARSVSFTSMPLSGLLPSVADSEISLLHLRVELRVCRVVQNLLALLRNPAVVKRPVLLQRDDQTGQLLPRRHWLRAVIPFPLIPPVEVNAATRPGGEPPKNLPTAATLLSLLGYCRYRTHFAMGPDQPKALGAGGAAAELHGWDPWACEWPDVLGFLATHAAHLLLASLHLEEHERDRVDGSPGPQVAAARATAIREALARLRPALDKCLAAADRLGPGSPMDGPFLAALLPRLEAALARLGVDTSVTAGPSGDAGAAERAALALAVAPVKPQRQLQLQLQQQQQHHAMMRAREAVLLPSLIQPATGLLLWLSSGQGTGAQGGPKAWEPVLRSLDLPGLRVLILDPRELMEAADGPRARNDGVAADSTGTVVSVFKDGQLVGLGAAATPTPTAARLAPPGLDALLQQSDAEGQLRDLLGRAAAAVGDAARSAAPLRELFALAALAPGAENRQGLLLGARRVREAALAQAASICDASAADPDNAAQTLARVVIGGFQRGGELALVAALAMALDPLPRKVGGVVAINAHLPLAAEIGQALVAFTAQLQAQHAAQHAARAGLPPPAGAAPPPALARSDLEAALPALLLRVGGRDEVLDPTLAELTARALYSAGAAVNFDVSETSSHEQWDMGQLGDVRAFVLGLLGDAPGAASPA
jgi:hypothetical protein